MVLRLRLRRGFGFGRRSTVLVHLKDVGHLVDGDVGGGVDLVDQFLHGDDLEAVDHHVNEGPGRVGVKTLGVHDGHAVLKGLRNGPAHLLLPDGDDKDPLGPVQALHDEVHRFEGGHVGDDGVEWEDPALEDHATSHMI